MTRFASLLLPLDGSRESAKGAGCALWLAQRLDATLHVLHASARAFGDSDPLVQLLAPEVRHQRVVFHKKGTEQADAAVLEAIALHGVHMVVMGACGASFSAGRQTSQLLGKVARAVIERSPVPVLLLPKRYREALPWTSMLVAASGDTAADQVLEPATQLAQALQLHVTVVHAADAPGATGSMGSGAYADAAYHEYPQRMHDMVERGLAHCGLDECKCIEQILLRRGDPAQVLLDLIHSHHASVLALGWHGTLEAGRALVLKRLLEETDCALLLVRTTETSTARLKVGEDIDS